MVPILNPIEEPEGFDERCRKKGNAWLIKNPGAERPADYWSPFRFKLADAFVDRCAYGAMYVSNGTVDHHISCAQDKTKAYEWSNYRYVEGWFNSSKRCTRVDDLLDPFEVGEGWFEVLLPSLQLVTTNAIPEEFRERAEKTLQDLPLKDDERLVRTRREWLRAYEASEVDIAGLRRKAPLIADAVEKREAAEAQRREVGL